MGEEIDVPEINEEGEVKDDMATKEQDEEEQSIQGFEGRKVRGHN